MAPPPVGRLKPPLLYEPLFVGLVTLLELLLLGLVMLALFVLLFVGLVTVVLLLLLLLGLVMFTLLLFVGLVTLLLLFFFLGEVSTLVPVPVLLLLGRTAPCSLLSLFGGAPLPPTTPPPTDGLWVVPGLKICSPPGVVVGLH